MTVSGDSPLTAPSPSTFGRANSNQRGQHHLTSTAFLVEYRIMGYITDTRPETFTAAEQRLLRRMDGWRWRQKKDLVGLGYVFANRWRLAAPHRTLRPIQDPRPSRGWLRQYYVRVEEAGNSISVVLCFADLNKTGDMVTSYGHYLGEGERQICINAGDEDVIEKIADAKVLLEARAEQLEKEQLQAAGCNTRELVNVFTPHSLQH